MITLNEIIYPQFWVAGVIEPKDGGGNLVVFAPNILGLINRSDNVDKFCKLARTYNEIHESTLIFINDISNLLEETNRSWDEEDIDWESALDDVAEKALAIFYNLNEAQTLMASGSSCPKLFFISSDGTRQATTEELQEFRTGLTDNVRLIWANYIQQLHDSGKLRLN